MVDLTSRLASRRLNRLLTSAAIGSLFGSFSFVAHAGGLPTGGQAIGGSATISTPSPTQMQINSSTSHSAISWQDFSIGQGYGVNVTQPNGGTQLEQVRGTNVSQIFGSLTSNGRIVIANPNGIWFGPHAQVDVAGLTATTARASDADITNFLNGGSLNLSQAGNANAAVVNQGHITISNAGLAAFVAPGVRNDGVIQAKLGTVQLSSGTTATLDFYGDGLISIAVTGQTLAQAIDPSTGKPMNAAVTNAGKLKADGGAVLVTADVATNVVDDVINVSGVVQARSVSQQDGMIVLDGGSNGNVQVAGTLDVSGTHTGETGGTVKVLGQNVTLAGTAVIDASGKAGGGKAYVGGVRVGGQTIGSSADTVTVDNGAVINVSALQSGNGGVATLWSTQFTSFDGTIDAMGGRKGGSGGFVETSGNQLSIGADASVNASAPAGNNGTWLLDPENVTISAATTTAENCIGTSCTPTGTGATVNNTQLDNWLASNNVVIDTGSAGSGSEAGNITVSTPVAWNSANTLTLTAHGNVSIGAAISATGGGSLAVTAAGSTGITQTAGILTVGGTSSFTTTTTGADITLNDSNLLTGAVSLNTTGTSGNASLTNENNTVLGTSNVGGTLSVTDDSGNLSQSGALTVHGSSSFTDSASDGTVALTNTANTLVGAVALDTTGASGNANLTNDASGGTDLAASTVGGNLTVVNRRGSLTQTGALMVGGTSSFTDQTNIKTIALTNTGNALTGAVSLETTGASGNASLTNNMATTLGASSVGGKLIVIDRIGNLTQNGALTVGGTSSFTTSASGGTISLANPGNALTGAVSLSTNGVAGDASLTNDMATTLAASTIGGSLTVTDLAGNLTLAALTAGMDVSLSSPGNVTQSGATTASSGTLTLGGIGTYNLTTGTNNIAHLVGSADSVSFTDDGGFDIAGLTVSGSVALSSTGTVSQSGVITANALLLTGANGIFNLGAVANDVHTLAANTGSKNGAVSFNDGGNNLMIGSVNGTNGITTGLLSLTDTGTVNQSQGIAATNLLLLGAGGTYDLDGSNSVSTLAAGTGTLTLIDKIALTVGRVSTTSGISTTGDVTLIESATSGGITFNDSVTAGGDLVASTIDGNIVLGTGVILSASGVGDAIVLEPGASTAAGTTKDGDFINKSGDSALHVSAGSNWVIYTGHDDSGGTVVGGLTRYTDRYDTDTTNFTPLSDANYVLYRIAPTLTVEPVASSRTYDGSTLDNAGYSQNTANYTITGFINGDTIASAGFGISGSMAFDRSTGTIVRNAGTYGLTQGTLSFADGLNYAVAFSNPRSNAYVITPRPIRVIAVSNTKVYDGGMTAAAIPVVTAGSIVAGDTADFVETYDTKNVGVGKTLTPSGAVSDGNSGNNYIVTSDAAALGVVTPAPLSIVADNATKPYDTTLAFAGTEFTPTGLRGGDTVATVTLTSAGTFANAPVGSYAIMVSDAAGGTFDPANYTITYVNGILTVTPLDNPAFAQSSRQTQNPGGIDDLVLGLSLSDNSLGGASLAGNDVPEGVGEQADVLPTAGGEAVSTVGLKDLYRYVNSFLAGTKR